MKRSLKIEFLLGTALLLSVADVPPRIAAQQPQPAASPAIPTFDIVSVKPNNSGARASATRRLDDGIQFENVPVDLVVVLAYQLDLPGQIINLPDWSKQANYDIEARVTGGDVAKFKALSTSQKFQSMQQVLTDRFQLTIHHESRQLPVYNLVLARNGPKTTGLKPVDTSKAGDSVHADPDNISMHNEPVSWLASELTHVIHRTVVDKTGLTGKYDLELRFRPDAFDPAMSQNDNSSADVPSLFTAIQEQLGLKLESAKGPVDCIVIDHVEKPTPN